MSQNPWLELQQHYGGVIISRPKLRGGEDVIMVGIHKDTFGNNLLKEFATTFQEADGTVGLGETIVRLTWFGDDDDEGILPRVMA